MQFVYSAAHLAHDITVETFMGLPIPANEVAERAEKIRESVFHYEGGIVEFVQHLNKARQVLHPKPVFLKGGGDGVQLEIDVEGFELEVLRGMAATIERCRPVFMIEYHRKTAKGVAEILRPFGYSPFVFDRHASAFRPVAAGEADNPFYLAPSQQSSVPIIGAVA